MRTTLVVVQAVLPREPDGPCQLHQIVQDTGGTGVHAQRREGNRPIGSWIVGIDRPGCVIDEQPHSPHSHGVVGQAVLDGLEATDRSTECLALTGVVDGSIKGALDTSERVGGEQKAMKAIPCRTGGDDSPGSGVDDEVSGLPADIEPVRDRIHHPCARVREEDELVAVGVGEQDSLGPGDTVE